MTQVESLSATFSSGVTAKNRKAPCRESREPVEPQVCCVWPRKFESGAKNELVRYDAAATFRGHSPHGQIIGQNGMYRTSAYPHLLRKFLDGDTMVLSDQVRTWSMSSSFRLVEGLPERASLYTDVRPSLNRFTTPAEFSEWFPLGYHQASDKI